MKIKRGNKQYEYLVRRNSKYKGHAVGTCLTCSRKSKAASAGAERAKGKTANHEIGGERRGQMRQDFEGHHKDFWLLH